MQKTIVTLLAVMSTLILSSDYSAAVGKPLKVYILAGQSNMEGHAKIETLGYLGDDPATAPLLQEMMNGDQPRICDRVWISYLTGSPEKGKLGEGFGKLTAGYGSRTDPSEPGGKIGPELTFGITMQKAYDGPVLIIKTAWGGKSLNTNFRPPSAGPYVFNQSHLEALEKRGKDIEQTKADKAMATGRYYRLMIDHVKKVLADPGRVVSSYDREAGYEVAGLVWFQGWNDMVDGNTYPNRKSPGGYDQYSELLAHFIRDVRRDLDSPELPFVIGVMGVGGIRDQPEYFRKAMSAPASTPEFRQHVVAVETAPFWDQPLANIEAKLGKPKKLSYYLRKNVPGKVVADNFPIAYQMNKTYWDRPPERRQMSNQDKQAYVKEFRSKVISAEEEQMWKRGASNAGYHYLGCGKTMALIGQAFARANLKLEKK